VRYDENMQLRSVSSFVSLGVALGGWLLGSAPLGPQGITRAGAEKAPDAATASKPSKGWVDYQSPDGLYRAKFPAAPQSETQKGPPTLVIARYQTPGGLNTGPMYYVAAMVGKTQNMPPPDLLPQLVTVAEKQGFGSLEVQVSESKPAKDSTGNPGRRLKLSHAKSHRTGIGKVVVNRLTGVILLVAGFGPDAEAFVKSAQFL
jgi:hypothetical protein